MSMTHSLIGRHALLGLALCLSVPAYGQFSASLEGTVLDASGAIVPKATATLTNLGTQQTLTATTNATGFYRFSELAPAHYKLTVAAPGFKTSSYEDISLAAESSRDLNVNLSVGGESDTVNVNANETPILQTSDASIQATIDSQTIQKLPVYGADPYEVLRLAPGITGDGARSGTGTAVFLPNAAGPGGSNSGVFQTENQVQISADGQRQADNNYIVDGVSVNSLTHGGAAVVTPNIEAVGQITTVSTSYDASDGRNSGAQIKVVTKSGTNDLHGSLFFLYDEPGLNAFNKYGGPAKGTLPVKVTNKQRSYAASLGGPIIKNKLFLFASYQGFTLANNNSVTAYVETPGYRSSVIANRPGGVTAKILSDPGVVPRIRAIIAPNCSGFNTYTPPATPGNPHPTPQPTCQVVNGGLDIGSLTPGGASQLGVFPAAPYGGGLDGVADVENAQLFVPAHARGNQFNGRADYHVTDKDLVAGSVYFTKLDNYGISGTAGSRPNADVPFKPLNSAATLIYIHTFSPSWLNEARGNGTRFADNALNDAGNTVNYGNPYVNVQTLPFPIQYGPMFSSTSPAVFAENTYEVRDMATHTWGSHTLRFGGEVRWEQDNDNLNGQQRPTYAFQGLWTLANDASIFEQIAANPVTGGTPLTQRYFRSEDLAAYIQHDWKVSPNLTLNMGLRWEDFTPLRNKGFLINYPVLGSTPGRELVDVTLQLKNHLWNAQNHNFAPKVGFAYVPEGFNHKAVIRGGFAMAYNHLDIGLFNPALEDGPGVALFNLCCAANGASAGVLYATGSSNSPSSFPANPALKTGIGPNGFPLQMGGGAQQESFEVYGALPNTRYPMSYLYSLETQFELPYQLTFTAGYAGSEGHHYARLVNQNFLFNQCIPATLNCNGTNVKTPVSAGYFAQMDSNQNYNALNLQLVRRMSNGFTLSAIYTYAKALDQVSNGDGADSNANQTNPANNTSEWGPSDYDTRQRVVVSGVYEFPHVHSDKMLVKAAANGWQVNGVMTYHSGFPWTPVTFNLQTVPNQIGAAPAGPVRPLAYNGQGGNSCSNSAWLTGSNFSNRTTANPGGGNYFSTALPPTFTYTPGIGRNSFQGPCYFDVDMSVAKEFAVDAFDRHMLLRFQANFYNAFNKLQLLPVTNGNANAAANIQNAFFGIAQGADAGRQIEFVARFQF
jgi:Carboxypeptidase regulatory-like domain